MRTLIVLMSALLLVYVVQDACGQVRYSVIDLGPGGALGINNSGQVVGQNGNEDAFLYSGGSMQNLNTLLGTPSSCAYAINDLGQVVGQQPYGGSIFLYSGGSMQNITTSGGTLFTRADGINDSGQIVGIASSTAFLYSGGSTQDLGTFGGTFSWAYGINNSGQIVGTATTSNDSQYAFLYSFCC